MNKKLNLNKKNNYDKIIDKIQNVRKKNNKNWMDILRLAFKSNPKAASKILSSIYKEDKKVRSLAKKLKKF